MIRSMSGFGAARVERGDLALRVEVRSVNHRHLQLKLRLPPDCLSLEARVEVHVKERLRRGSVQVAIHLDQDQRNHVSVDRALATRYSDLLHELASDLGLEEDVGLGTLVGLPGVLSSEGEDHDQEQLAALLLDGVGQAIDALVAMRETEGAHMVKDLEQHLGEIEAVTASVAERAPAIVVEQHASLQRRVNELLDGTTRVEPQDLARELALLADKSDINEELARLESHLAQFRGVLAKGGEVGRKLDFLTQEFLREVNTIGSKTPDSQTTHQVVQLKTLVERLREQVQNLE